MVTFCISLTHVNALTWSIITIHPNMSHHSQENRCRFGPCKGHILFSRTHLVISFYAVSFEFEHHHNFKILFLFFQRISSKSSVDDLYINNFPSFKSSKFSLSLSLSLSRTQKFEIWAPKMEEMDETEAVPQVHSRHFYPLICCVSLRSVWLPRKRRKQRDRRKTKF